MTLAFGFPRVLSPASTGARVVADTTIPLSFVVVVFAGLTVEEKYIAPAINIPTMIIAIGTDNLLDFVCVSIS